MLYAPVSKREARAAKPSLIIIMMIMFVSLLGVGCGDSTEDFVVTGNNNGNTTPGTLTFNFVKAQDTTVEVPQTTTSIRFQFLNATGGVIATQTELFAPQITVTPPEGTARIRITALDNRGFPLFSLEGAESRPANGVNRIVNVSTWTATDITLTSVTATPDPVTVTAGTNTGNTQQLTLTAGFSNGETVVLSPAAVGTATFNPDNSGRFTVNSNGVVSAAQAGNGQLTVSLTSENVTVTDTVAVQVSGGTVDNDTFVVSPDPLEAGIGSTSQPLTATFSEVGEEPRVIANNLVDYTTTTPGFTINEDGTVTVASSVAVGTTATITATWTDPSDQQTFTDTITVIAVNSRAFLNPTGGSLELPSGGFLYQLVAAENGSVVQTPGASGYTFRSSDTSVANVTSTGALNTGGDAGTSTIELLYNGVVIDSFTLTVSNTDIVSITVNPDEFLLTPGQIVPYTVLATYENGNTANIAGSPLVEIDPISGNQSVTDTLFFLGRAVGGTDRGEGGYNFSIDGVDDNVTVTQAVGFISDFEVTVGGLASGNIPNDLQGVVDVHATLASGEVLRLRPDQFELEEEDDSNFYTDGDNIIESDDTNVGDTGMFSVTLNTDQFIADDDLNVTREFTVTSVSNQQGVATVEFTNYTDDSRFVQDLARPITVRFSNGEVTNFKVSDRNTSTHPSTDFSDLYTDSDIWGYPVLDEGTSGFDGTLTIAVRTDTWDEFIATASMEVEMRLRYKLVTSGRLNRLLLAEEATGLAFSGLGQDVALNAEGALSLLEAEASSNMDESARIRQIEAAHERLSAYRPAIEAFAHQRGEALSHDHLRLTEAAGGGATVKVTPVLPADIIGLYVMLPEVN